MADVAAVLDQPVTSLLDSVRQATDGGILVELPDRLAFRHPLVRTVLDDELPASAHQALHQVAQALATRTSPERVAEHLLAAARPRRQWCPGSPATRTNWPPGPQSWPPSCSAVSSTP